MSFGRQLSLNLKLFQGTFVPFSSTKLVPKECLHCICLDCYIKVAILGVKHLQNNSMCVFVEQSEHITTVRSLEDGHQNVRVCRLCVVVHSHRIGYEKFAKVSEGVEKGLLVVLVAGSVHDDGSIDKVAYPVGTSLQVENNVPVCPACSEVVQILKNEQNIKQFVVKDQ